MAKRRADKYLTLENFDKEDDEEEVSNDGDPPIASESVMRNRIIRKARRMIEPNTRSDVNIPPKTAFSGFKGFTTTTTTTTTPQPSSTFANQFALFASQSSAKRSDTSQMLTNGTTNSNTKSSTSESESEKNYFKKLRQLNKDFKEHIELYMRNNECVYDFTQVCNEYVIHQKKIEDEKNKTANECQPKAKESEDSDTDGMPNLTFERLDKCSQESSSIDLFSQRTRTSNTTISPLSSQASANQSSQSQLFGSNESLKSMPHLFPFSSNSNLPNTTLFPSFGTVGKAPSESTAEDTAEEEYNPPKVESVEHLEDNSLYHKKCKLYFKKDNEYTEKGVGTLFIKRIQQNSCQLLIRANNTMGNVLLNIMLSASLPISKAEKNKGVILVCKPNPPLDLKSKSADETVCFLIRVREADCNELYDKLKTYQQSS